MVRTDRRQGVSGRLDKHQPEPLVEAWQDEQRRGAVEKLLVRPRGLPDELHEIAEVVLATVRPELPLLRA